MAEVEGKGVDYERYALDRLFRRLVAQHGIGSVLEVPAGGEKAMPSVYSLAFATAGCRVTLVNPVAASLRVWDELGLAVETRECAELTDTGLGERDWDLVWHFAAMARYAQPQAVLSEMVRLSRRFVMFIGVNRFNPGFFCHRLAHRLCKVPWSHGDVAFMNPFRVRRYFRENGLAAVKTGAVDTPPYPDSLGFRDMRLHRKNTDPNALEWESRTVQWMKTGEYPAKIRLMYLLERLPVPLPIKLLYAHLFYVLGRVPD